MKRILLGFVMIVFSYGLSAQTLNGKWLLQMNSTDIGYTEFFITIDTAGQTFTAHTANGAARKVLGPVTATLARTFTNTMKHGALVRLSNGKVTGGDTVKLSAIFVSAWGSYYFKGRLENGELLATLTNGKGKYRGTIKGRQTSSTTPLKNYSLVTDSALAIAREKIFNGEIVQGRKWKKFERKIRKTAAKANDDIEMITAFFYRASKLGVSHFAFIRKGGTEETVADETHKNITLEEKSPETVYMAITSFGGTAAEVDSVFAVVKSKNYKNLIVDLRNNSGGSVEAGMRFASHLSNHEYFAGVFLTRKWFNSHTTPPTVADYPQLPHFTEANFNLIIKGVHEKEGLCLKMIPVENPYGGKVYILTNRVTASTCEPIVYGMKQYRMATIVGTTTAGRMLNGEFFDIYDGYTVIVPTADYYTADGYRIDQNGVKPDIDTKKDDALTYVLNEIAKSKP